METTECFKCNKVLDLSNLYYWCMRCMQVPNADCWTFKKNCTIVKVCTTCLDELEKLTGKAGDGRRVPVAMDKIAEEALEIFAEKQFQKQQENIQKEIGNLSKTFQKEADINLKLAYLWFGIAIILIIVFLVLVFKLLTWWD